MQKIFLATIFFTLSLFAQPGAWMPTAKKISGIIVEGKTTGFATIVIEGGVPSEFVPSECRSPYNSVDLSTDKGRGILSIALAARMANKPVKLVLSCIGARPLITHIWL